MARYVVESYDYSIFYAGQDSDGALGKGGGSEKIYLHVLEVSDDDLARLRPREDDNGNQQSDRRALPNHDEWWIAVDGDKVWPKTVRPKVVSHCVLDGGVPVPAPISEAELEQLRKAGASLA